MIEYLSGLALSGFSAVIDYLLAHTLFCLIPAFFIAGGMAALIKKDELMPYLGKNSPKYVSYPIAVVSGLLLAVCSCTVLPLFAGIRKGGAGIGPALAFLYTAPATNIIAILYTGSLIGWDIAAARIMFSVIFAVVVGIVISRMYPDDGATVKTDLFAKKRGGNKRNGRLYLFFGLLLAILLAGTRISEELLKYGVEMALIAALFVVVRKCFSKEEVSSWLGETYSLAKAIIPLLLVGVFASGMIRAGIPENFVSSLVGGTDFFSLALPALFGIFVYFPTLVEVPMAKTFLELGMSKAALLTYLLADPVISLPSILAINKMMGSRRTLAYVIMIFLLTIAAGMVYGLLAM